MHSNLMPPSGSNVRTRGARAHRLPLARPGGGAGIHHRRSSVERSSRAPLACPRWPRRRCG